jgi:hypothetical protein
MAYHSARHNQPANQHSPVVRYLLGMSNIPPIRQQDVAVAHFYAGIDSRQGVPQPPPVQQPPIHPGAPIQHAPPAQPTKHAPPIAPVLPGSGIPVQGHAPGVPMQGNGPRLARNGQHRKFDQFVPERAQIRTYMRKVDLVQIKVPLHTTKPDIPTTTTMVEFAVDAKPDHVWHSLCTTMEVDPGNAQLGWRLSPIDPKTGPPRQLRTAEDIRQAFRLVNTKIQQARSQMVTMEIANLVCSV